MMASVPGVEHEIFFKTYFAKLGMAEGASPVFRLQRAQKANPPRVQGIEQGQGNFNGSGLRVAELRPEVFGVGLDCGGILGKGELEANVGVQMAVGNMVRDLAQRPAFGTVGRVELLIRKVFYSGAQVGWGLFGLVYLFLFLV